MRILRTSAGLGGLMAPALLITLVIAGCGKEAAITGASTTPVAAVQLADDPLDGSLTSTDGFTPPDPHRRIDRLARILGLSDEQKQALLVAYEELRAGIESLRAQVAAGDLGPDEARRQARALREAFEAELQLILTPEEYDLLQEMRAAPHGHGRHGRSLGDRWDAWLREIGADRDQVRAVKRALAVLHAGMEDLRRQVRAGDLDRERAREQAQALRDSFDAALRSILTPEQYERLQELRPDCTHRRR